MKPIILTLISVFSIQVIAAPNVCRREARVFASASQTFFQNPSRVGKKNAITAGESLEDCLNKEAKAIETSLDTVDAKITKIENHPILKPANLKPSGVLYFKNTDGLNLQVEFRDKEYKKYVASGIATGRQVGKWGIHHSIADVEVVTNAVTRRLHNCTKDEVAVGMAPNSPLYCAKLRKGYKVTRLGQKQGRWGFNISVPCDAGTVLVGWSYGFPRFKYECGKIQLDR